MVEMECYDKLVGMEVVASADWEHYEEFGRLGGVGGVGGLGSFCEFGGFDEVDEVWGSSLSSPVGFCDFI
ncbi:hypothetical protein [Cohnella fermenti]|uniref:Uncharacterized protein n=1 Tax=Cohnella fermenti TaxID=2565925 RepID=A0A4S4C914_9BACL|nr:hypothetical protein [Cohnella fermenti]THF84540.1 hypothetical protein E6C55_00725 [Cohnella fermenti]